MKKYTLEQLKTEKIKISVKTEQISSALMKKFEEHNISWCGGEKATSYKKYGEYTLVNLCDAKGYITFGAYGEGYTIITPDQIDWGEPKKADAGQDNSPAVIAKAVKDWNAFKSFVKEIETHGRTLTSAQLKAYMAKERKLRGTK